MDPQGIATAKGGERVKTTEVDFPFMAWSEYGGVPLGERRSFTYAELESRGVNPADVDGVGEIEDRRILAALFDIMRERGDLPARFSPGPPA